jgi:hypothetical protein
MQPKCERGPERNHSHSPHDVLHAVVRINGRDHQESALLHARTPVCFVRIPVTAEVGRKDELRTALLCKSHSTRGREAFLTSYDTQMRGTRAFFSNQCTRATMIHGPFARGSEETGR